MQNKPRLQAILWDMDGVLVDTFDGHYRSWQQTMDELNQPYDVDIFTRTFGMNNRLIMTTVFGRELEEDFIQRASDRKEEIFRADIKASVRLFPDAAVWLEKFNKMGILQAVASSAPQANIDALLDEFGIRGYFQAEAAGATLRGKPDPAVFLLAAQKLGVDPIHCLVIEDAIAGVEAARRGGMRCLAVQTTNPAKDLAGADVILKDLGELKLELLEPFFDLSGLS